MPRQLDFEAIFRNSPNPYVVIDRDLNIITANKAYLEATGHNLDGIVGQNIFTAFTGAESDSDNLHLARASLDRVLRERVEDTLTLIPYSVSLKGAEGEEFQERYWSLTHTPILDEAGTVVLILQHAVDLTKIHNLTAGKEPIGVDLGLFVQAEERIIHHIEDRRRDTEKERDRYRQLFQQAPGFMAILRGPRHVFELANAAYDELVGGRELLGKPIRKAIPEVDGQGFFELLDRVYETGLPATGRETRVVLQRNPNAPTEERYVDFVYQPIIEEDGSISGIFVQGHDVTVQKRATDELRRYKSELEDLVAQRTNQVRSLTESLTLSEERERQRIAQILHDDLQQILYSIRMQMRILHDHVASGKEVDVATAMNEIVERLTGGIQVTRSLAVELSPPLLKNESMGEALEWLAKSMEESYGLHVDVAIEKDCTRLSQERRVLLFGLVREMLFNVVKHAGVDRARLVMAEDAERCLVTVIDEGRGIDMKDRLDPNSGLGLSDAANRLHFFGGRMDIESESGKGTSVFIAMPLMTSKDSRP